MCLHDHAHSIAIFWCTRPYKLIVGPGYEATFQAHSTLLNCGEAVIIAIPCMWFYGEVIDYLFAFPCSLTLFYIIMQGAASLVFAPTILDVGEQLGVSVGVLSAMFFCRAAGSAIGSVSAGVALDKLVNYPYTIISLILVASIASELMHADLLYMWLQRTCVPLSHCAVYTSTSPHPVDSCSVQVYWALWDLVCLLHTPLSCLPQMWLRWTHASTLLSLPLMCGHPPPPPPPPVWLCWMQHEMLKLPIMELSCHEESMEILSMNLW
jgi:hypothetical protein